MTIIMLNIWIHLDWHRPQQPLRPLHSCLIWNACNAVLKNVKLLQALLRSGPMQFGTFGSAFASRSRPTDWTLLCCAAVHSAVQPACTIALPTWTSRFLKWSSEEWQDLETNCEHVIPGCGNPVDVFWSWRPSWFSLEGKTHLHSKPKNTRFVTLNSANFWDSGGQIHSIRGTCRAGHRSWRWHSNCWAFMLSEPGLCPCEQFDMDHFVRLKQAKSIMRNYFTVFHTTISYYFIISHLCWSVSHSQILIRKVTTCSCQQRIVSGAETNQMNQMSPLCKINQYIYNIYIIKTYHKYI